MRNPDYSKGTDDLVGLTVQQIMDKRGVRPTKAYGLRRAALASQFDENVPQNQKTLILRALAGGQAGDINELRARVRDLGLELDSHNMVHVVWALQKTRHVTFAERGNGLFRIKLTRHGAAGLGQGQNGKMRGRARIGVDPTDFRSHGYTAKGGPIEHIQAIPQPEAIPAMHYVETDLTKIRPIDIPNYGKMKAQTAYPMVEALVALRRPASAAELGRILGVSSPAITQWSKAARAFAWVRVISEVGNIKMLEPTQAGETIVKANTQQHLLWSHIDEETPALPHILLEGAHKDVEVITDTPTQYRLDGYPLIAATMTKQSRLVKYEAAAAILGDDDADMVLMLLEKIQLTDLEKEIIRFVGEPSA